MTKYTASSRTHSTGSSTTPVGSPSQQQLVAILVGHQRGVVEQAQLLLEGERVAG